MKRAILFDRYALPGEPDGISRGLVSPWPWQHSVGYPPLLWSENVLYADSGEFQESNEGSMRIYLRVPTLIAEVDVSTIEQTGRPYESLPCTAELNPKGGVGYTQSGYAIPPPPEQEN